MCEQTEINYLDGDVVWVKLGACWWPGQVIGLHNLPEDIQAEFQKKPLIAAVKFFQEDTYEFVKNYQQIYKYNCTLKDEFIRKGLDKYRSKSKDGASYMDKFPGDVEMAEKLTGGDPDILNREKFSPEEKPDISSLFGEKKIPKKKRDREDMNRRSDGSDMMKKITHPRFLRGESDHEVRIRQQPSNLPSTPTNSGSPQYPCHICGFTSSRVNVIICHLKIHRSGDSPPPRVRVKTYSQSHSRISDTSKPKRSKYVRKDKSQSSKKKSDGEAEPRKRKHIKQNEKSSKKKKTDPELREKLLADWDDESDEEISVNVNNSLNSSIINNSPTKSQSSANISQDFNEESDATTDNNEILAETEKLLKETEELTSMRHSLDKLHASTSLRLSSFDRSPKKFESEKDSKAGATSNESKSSKKNTSTSDSNNKNTSSKDDNKSRLSCFDFDEDDLSEPSPPVRKIPRVFGEKNLSVKKEMIKEFEMSQALKNEIKKESEKIPEFSRNMELKADEIMEIIQGCQSLPEKKETKSNEKPSEDVHSKTGAKQPEEKAEKKLTSSDENNQQKSNANAVESEVKMHDVEVEDDRSTKVKKTAEKQGKAFEVQAKIDESSGKKDEMSADATKADENSSFQSEKTDSGNVTTEPNESVFTKEADDTLSERFTTETEDETVSESAETMPEQSENSDIDVEHDHDNKFSGKRVGHVTVKRGRGRPRKNAKSTSRGGSVDKSLVKVRDSRSSKRFRISEKIEFERKTSDSDTDRSYSGRKRKPNKKYLEPDIYVQNLDYKALRTDESQSESDDKASEKITSKSRRGRRSKNVAENKSSELVAQIDKQEIEITDQTPTVTANNVSVLSIDTKFEVLERNISKEKKLIDKPEEKLDAAKKLVKLSDKETTKKVNTDVPLKDVETPMVPETTSKIGKLELDADKTVKSSNVSPEKKVAIKQNTNAKEHLKDEDKSPAIQQTEHKLETQREVPKTSVDMLPPKKSQIKKFELSQIDYFDTDVAATNKPAQVEPEAKIESKLQSQPETKKGDVEKTVKEGEVAIKLTAGKMTEITKFLDVEHKEKIPVKDSETKSPEKPKKSNEKKEGTQSEEVPQKTEDVIQSELKTPEKTDKPNNAEGTPKSAAKVPTAESPLTPKKSSMQTRYKGKFTPETGAKGKKDKDLFLEDSKPANTFQEAFLKTLHMDKKMEGTEKPKKGKKVSKKKTEEADVNVTPKSKVDESNKDARILENIQSEVNVSNVEMVVEEKLEVDTKVGDTVFTTDQLGGTPGEFVIVAKSPLQSSASESNAKNTSDVKEEEILKVTSVPASSLSPSDISVPVKKREMPRIIENVALTEPMQILKTKLLDKLPQKGVKHKLESDVSKKGDSKGSPKTKIMKIESLPSNSKAKGGAKASSSPHISLTKKLQVLKTEETEALLETQKKQKNASGTDKYAQSGSQNLAEMELDINSMPFVLSDDVLTPESIEQMPVVISSIIPASSSIPATLSFTPTTQIVSPTVQSAQFQVTNETATEAVSSSTKKKSGVPAILKNKKAKPTITSVKTLVPPLTGGVKGLKFQTTQSPSNTTPPLLTQKGATPGKYVVVQTAGGQQLRYSVQGKAGTQQKIAIPTGKPTAGNAQVVQQGNKVVILTAAQSCQAKMVPLNISKMGGKMQRIVTSKGQVLCPISPQSGIITSKAILAPKTDASGSPTTSKLVSGAHKIINTQGIITSKAVLTPITGKTTLLGTLAQGILTKNLYTPISGSTLSGKTLINPKVVTKGTALLSPQSLSGTKAILTPVTQTIAGKAILNTQAIVGSKGTVLTPITGQQVKAIAAKSPTKVNKTLQYQQLPQKMQLQPLLQKSPKMTISSTSPQGKVSATLKSPGSSTLVLQNTVSAATTPKTGHGKKIIKQIVQPAVSIQNIASPSGTQQTVTVVSQQVSKGGKAAATLSNVQKVIIPRSTGRQSKTQQKIVMQKIQEPVVSTVQSIHAKQVIAATSGNLPITAKTIVHSKQTTPTKSTKSSSKAQSQMQKNLLNVAMNSIGTATTNANIITTLTLPSLEPIDTEKRSKAEHADAGQKEMGKTEKGQTDKSADASDKTEQPKVSSQPQIMALPTESSDGTQTYVLVTIDEQGQIQPLDNNTLMSLEGTTQNQDGTRTLYIDPSSLGESGALDNIVLQFDNGIMPNIQSNVTTEPSQTIITESFPASEVIQTSNQDILAAALANTDFQQEISLPENQSGSVMATGLTQASLINQTILQSTIIPPAQPISSPSVLETSLTLNQPIMTPLEVPSNLPIQSDSTPTSTTVVSTIPSSLELPITITNPNISYISSGEAPMQLPGNSMPDIGEIMESPVGGNTEIDRTEEISVSTQYLVIPNLEDNIAVTAAAEPQDVQNAEIAIPSASYSVTMSNNIALESPQVQTTPSMPIIDDTFAENSQFAAAAAAAGQSIVAETFADVPVSEILVSKAPASAENAPDITVTSEMIVSSHQVPASPQKPIISTNESKGLDQESTVAMQEVYSSHDVPITSEELILQQPAKEVSASSSSTVEVAQEAEAADKKSDTSMATCLPMVDETTLVTSESNSRIEPMEQQVVATSNEVEATSQVLPAESLDHPSKDAAMEVDEEAVQSEELYAGSSTTTRPADCQRDEPSSQEETDSRRLRESVEKMRFEEETSTEAISQETPSQSQYEQFSSASVTSDSADLPSQSAVKSSESTAEATQSSITAYEPMETDEEAVVAEPPTQSFEHSKVNEASQSYETSAEANVNAPTQSFNEIMQSQEDRPSADETVDDQSFPTQSYEVDKGENAPENLETDAEISQEGNVPSQSNDIGVDGIGTSSVSTNNSGLNEDETASSSYVPETPENQERDQEDQESAISTSSYEIPPCEELNIASSSVIPDTSVSAEHSNINDNGVPEIPTSSYNLNPDITSTHVDSGPTSSYEDQVIVEQNVSTSYEVPISMPGLDETCSQNFVTESTDHRNEPSSYYAHHQEVTASYYESVDQDANSRLEGGDPHEEVTPGYYEGNPQEVSQSYFAPAEETPNYTSHSISPSYYDPRPEGEASQSYYSTDELDKTEQSSSPNIEASQSFYQERSGELRLRQQGEATPTYSEGYPVDYTLESSPIERHDLVESSVPATRPMER